MSAIRNDHVDLATFFYQGNGASRFQATQYAGANVPVTTTTKTCKRISSSHPSAPRLLHNIHIYPEIPEVGYGFSWNPIHWIMQLISLIHGLVRGIKTSHPHYINWWNMSVGGSPDVAHHQRYVKDFLQDKSKSKVLFGCSRGAVTTLVSVAGLPPHQQQQIGLVIVEAPFDTVPSVLSHSAWIPPSLQLLLLRTLGSYQDDQVSPLQAIEHFPLDVPIAFITSRTDARVPPKCTQCLIDRLRSRGHPNLHHLELKSSPHGTMSLDNAADQTAYLEFVENLYERYC